MLFLTSFDYAAAASIIDVVAAEDQGYSTTSASTSSSSPASPPTTWPSWPPGRAQMTSLGSFSEVAVANGSDADLVAVGVEGKTSIEELLVENDKGIDRAHAT